MVQGEIFKEFVPEIIEAGSPDLQSGKTLARADVAVQVHKGS